MVRLWLENPMAPLSQHIFNTVPKEDYLSLFEDKRPSCKHIAEILEFKKQDVSSATGVSVSSVRYDEKMPDQVRERMREWATLLNLVAEYFRGDEKKTIAWFTMPNPLLGNVSPRTMIRSGRYKKLLVFVFNALNENK